MSQMIHLSFNNSPDSFHSNSLLLGTVHKRRHTKSRKINLPPCRADTS